MNIKILKDKQRYQIPEYKNTSTRHIKVYKETRTYICIRTCKTFFTAKTHVRLMLWFTLKQLSVHINLKTLKNYSDIKYKTPQIRQSKVY